MYTVFLALLMGGVAVVWSVAFLPAGLLGLRLQRVAGRGRRAEKLEP